MNHSSQLMEDTKLERYETSKKTKILDLSKCSLYNLNFTSSELRNIKELNLSKNKLVDIEENIINILNRLVKLNISYNKLTCIPDSIGKLQNLTQLDLKSNEIDCIPLQLFQLKQLQELDLSFNKIKVIPSKISMLVNLVELKLSRNKIQTIPPEIGKLKNLRKLHIDDNQITVLPAEFEELDLKVLLIQDNPLKSPPISIAKNGIAFIKHYIANDITIAKNTIARGKGLYSSKVNKNSTFTILTKNKIGENRNVGGDIFNVYLLPIDKIEDSEFSPVEIIKENLNLKTITQNNELLPSDEIDTKGNIDLNKKLKKKRKNREKEGKITRQKKQKKEIMIKRELSKKKSFRKC